MSKTPPPDPFAGIAEAAAAAEEQADGVPAEERLAALESRLASIEPLLEQLQAQSALGLKIKDYVDDLRAEQRFFNVARWTFGILSLAIIIGFGWLLRDAVYHPRSPLLTAPPLAIAAFVVGISSAIVLLLSAFLKGIFRSAADRHSDGFLPPSLNASLEAYQKLIGKS